MLDVLDIMRVATPFEVGAGDVVLFDAVMAGWIAQSRDIGWTSTERSMGWTATATETDSSGGPC